MAKVLGIDFGESRIGLALSDTSVCAPLKIISGKNWGAALGEIKKIVDENNISFIVIGIPTKNEERVKQFYKYLKSRLWVEIKLWNEDFSSKEALEYAIKMGYSKKGRRHLDDVAASMILESYFASLT